MLVEAIKIFLKGGIILRVILFLPMIPLTIAYFSHDGNEKTEIRKDHLGYCYDHAHYIYPKDTSDHIKIELKIYEAD